MGELNEERERLRLQKIREQKQRELDQKLLALTKSVAPEKQLKLWQ